MMISNHQELLSKHDKQTLHKRGNRKNALDEISMSFGS